MSDQPDKVLVRFTGETYEGSFRTDLLEQYKLYVQSADNASARRIATSNYLLAVNAALVVLFGGMLSADLNGLSSWIILVPGVGIAVSLLWHSLIKSYSDLNTIKFRIIQELEEHLPAALYQYEWELAEAGQGRGYQAVTKIERHTSSVWRATRGVGRRVEWADTHCSSALLDLSHHRLSHRRITVRSGVGEVTESILHTSRMAERYSHSAIGVRSSKTRILRIPESLFR